MNWETRKALEYIQNDKDVLEELSDKTDTNICVLLCKSYKFRQYIFDLFMENVDFEELENELKDDTYPDDSDKDRANIIANTELPEEVERIKIY